MGKHVVHFEIMAKNGRRPQAFYSSLFDWNINANNPMNYGLLDTGKKKNGINGGIGEVQKKQQPSVTFYVEVEDCQKYLNKAVGLGGKIIVPVTEIPNMVTLHNLPTLMEMLSAW